MRTMAARPAGAARITRITLCVLLVVAGAGGLPGAAQDRPDVEPAAEAGLPEAPVVVWNRTITVFRAPFLGVPPEGRARRAEEVVEQLLERGGPGAVTVTEQPQGQVLFIDGSFAFVLTPEDPDRLRAETLPQAAAAAVRALEQVSAETRESRDARLLLRATLRAAAVTLVFVVLLYALRRGRSAVARRLTGRLTARVSAVTGARAAFVQRERIVRGALTALSILGWALSGLLWYWWLGSVLSQFPYTRAWGERLSAFLLGVAGKLGSSFLGAIPDLVVAVAVFLLARAIVGAAGAFFERIESGAVEISWLDRDMARPTRRIVVLLIWLFALVMGLPYLPGAHSEAFRGVSVLVGLMVTVGASGVVSHGASGLILLYSGTLRVGEYVRIGDHEGLLTEIGTFTTRIRTGSGEDVTLPNAFVLGTVTRNYSRHVQGAGYLVTTTVTIGYDTPWRQVDAMLREAALRTPGVAAAPPPRVLQTQLSDFYPEYRLVCTAVPEAPAPRSELLSALNANIQDVFNEYGVQIMSPHYEGDPAEPKVVAAKDRYAAPAHPPRV